MRVILAVSIQGMMVGLGGSDSGDGDPYRDGKLLVVLLDTPAGTFTVRFDDHGQQTQVVYPNGAVARISGAPIRPIRPSESYGSSIKSVTGRRG